MLPIALYYEDIAQAALAPVSAVLAVVAMRSYRRRSETRQLLLVLAFVLFCIASVGTTLLELLVSVGPTTVLFAEEYLTPSLELLVGACLLVAVAWAGKEEEPPGRASSREAGHPGTRGTKLTGAGHDTRPES